MEAVAVRLFTFLFAVVILIAVTETTYASTIILPAGGDFQAALNTAKPGDMIILQAGASYTVINSGASFVLPAKTGGTGPDADYITIQSSQLSQLTQGRVAPGDKAKMPKIVALGFAGAITALPNAKYYKFVGIEVTNSSGGTANEHAY